MGALVEVHVDTASSSAMGGKQVAVVSLPAVAIPEAKALMPEAIVA